MMIGMKIQLILLAVTIGVVAGHFLLRPATDSVESFRNPLAEPVPAPTGEEGTTIETDTDTLADVSGLDAGANDEDEDDPRDLPWIASWNAADRSARDGQNCRPKYFEVGPNGTTIVTVSKSCESGMPHTLAGDRIVIPDSVREPARTEVIAHELVHIHQRRYPSLWLKFYRGNWDFTFAPQPPREMPVSVITARRSNPDTWDPAGGGPWACWRGRWWPVPVYRDPVRPRLRETETVWWDQTTGDILREPPAPWAQFFGRPAQDEHPHEIAAVKIVAEESATEAGRRLQTWWRANQNPPY